MDWRGSFRSILEKFRDILFRDEFRVSMAARLTELILFVFGIAEGLL